MFPNIVERLRGTPPRVAARIEGLPSDLLTRRLGGNWSILENVGHLTDLEPLWIGRVEDILSGLEIIRPADLTNKATHDADHNETSVEELLHRFDTARRGLVARLDVLKDDLVGASALHPRLRQPMRIIDLAFFVAEHDDHHLATISRILRTS